jgi:hypothetical protein
MFYCYGSEASEKRENVYAIIHVMYSVLLHVCYHQLSKKS